MSQTAPSTAGRHQKSAKKAAGVAPSSSSSPKSSNSKSPAELKAKLKAIRAKKAQQQGQSGSATNSEGTAAATASSSLGAGENTTASTPEAPSSSPKRKRSRSPNNNNADSGSTTTVVPAPSTTTKVDSADSAPPTNQQQQQHQQQQQQQQQQRSGRELNKRLWAKDALYRIVRKLPRGDVVHIVKCKLKEQDCVKANRYISEAAPVVTEEQRLGGHGGIRELRLQMAVPMEKGLSHFLPLLSASRYTLRKLDLSRNQLAAADVPLLVEQLDLGAKEGNSQLEVLDLSYNVQLGDSGCVALLQALGTNSTIKAVILKHCGLTDAGCTMMAMHLAQRPYPVLLDGSTAEPTFGGQAAVGQNELFFLNLNENCVGAAGQVVLSRHLPAHVSLTLAKQVLRGKPNVARE